MPPEVYDLDIRAVDPRVDAGWVIEETIQSGLAPRPWAWPVPNFGDLAVRVPTKVLLAALVLGLGAAVGVSAAHPSPRSSAAPDVVTIADDPNADDPHAVALTAMVASAQSSRALRDSVDTGATCPSPLAGQARPANAIIATATRYLPQFQLRDSAQGVTKSGVCWAEVRLRSADGVALMLTVTAPPNQGDVYVARASGNGVDSIDVVALIDGWRVEIGATGAPTLVPSAMQLTDLGTDARLRWSP